MAFNQSWLILVLFRNLFIMFRYSFAFRASHNPFTGILLWRQGLWHAVTMLFATASDGDIVISSRGILQ